jgi:hypothetical protein
MPVLRLHAESNNLSNIEVEHRAVFILPDPDLVRVVATVVNNDDQQSWTGSSSQSGAI